MNTANQERSDNVGGREALSSQYHTMIDGWAEVSKCCLAAADDMTQTGFDYVKDQVEQLHEIACNPTSAMREETFSKTLNCSFDAADRFTQAYLHSLESVREPLMRVVSVQWPISRSLAQAMEHGMQRGMEAMQKGTEETMQRGAETMQRGTETMEKGAERMEKNVRGVARGAEEAQQHHGRRKSA